MTQQITAGAGIRWRRAIVRRVADAAHVVRPRVGVLLASSTGHRAKRVGRVVWAAHDRLIAYLLPVLCVLVATSRWFSAGAFIASGDVAPYARVNLASEVTSLWNHQASGGGSSYYAILQLPDVLLLWLTASLGISGPIAQHLQFDLILSTATVGLVYLARVWLRSPWSAALAGLVGVFNYFVLTTLPNLLPALAIGTTGLLCGRILRVAMGAPLRVAGTAALTIVLGYLAQNPPLLVVTGVVAMATAAAARLLVAEPYRQRSARRACGHLLMALPLAGLVNLWWLVPFCQTVLDGQGLTFTAQTNAGAWAWTQVRATVNNVLTLNTNWGWNEPQYYPYAARASSGPSAVVRWVLPALALVGLLGADRRRRRSMLTLAAAAIVLVFLAKGTHAPGGQVNLWLYAHVPGFWLLRDPMSKLGVALVAVYAIAAGVGVERCAVVLQTRRNGLSSTSDNVLSAGRRRTARIAGLVVITVVAATAVAAPWPLWTGTVTPSVNPLLAPARVTVPTAWYRLADKVNKSAGTGKTLILPLDPFYQVTTKWGFHGADEIPTQLLTNPVLAELPGGYFGTPSGLSNLLNGVQTAAVTGDYAEIPGLLRALGVTNVIVRSDILDTPETPTSADPSQLVAAFERTQGLSETARSSVGSVFHLDGNDSLVSASSTLVGIRAQDPVTLFANIGSLAAGVTATTGNQPTSGFTWQISAQGARTFDLAAGSQYRGRLAATSTNAFRVFSEQSDGQPVLRVVDVDNVSVDGHQLAANLSSTIPVTSSDVVGVSANGTFEPVGAGGAPVVLSPAQVLTAYAPAPRESTALGTFGSLSDCDNSASAPSTETRLSRTTIPGGFSLGALRHTACVSAPVTTTDVVTVIEVSFQYRTVRGLPARVCLYQGSLGCADLPSPNSGTAAWQQYQALVQVPAGAQSHLFLYADGSTTGVSPTEVRYRNVSVRRLVSVGSGRISSGSSALNPVRLTPGRHRVAFTSVLPAATPLSFSSLGDCNAVQPLTAILALVRSADGSLTLRAASDSACVASSARNTAGSSRFQLQGEYRTNSGLPARICVWEIGPNKCATLPALQTSTQWTTLSVAVTPEPGTRSLQVYLYADGQAAPQTSVQYRNVELERTAPQLLVVTPVSTKKIVAPMLTTTRQGNGDYRATVRGAHMHFVLDLADSYAAGWNLSGLPRGWTAEHFVANGYANGWLVSGTGSAVLRLTYGPARLDTAAQYISISALAALLLEGVLLLARASAGSICGAALRRLLRPRLRMRRVM